MDGENPYDFDCPQFVDFTGPNLLVGDDEADKYFEFDHENGGIPVGLGVEPSPQCTPEAAKVSKTPNTPRMTRSAKAKTPAKEVEKPEPRKTPRVMRSKSVGVLTPSVSDEVKSNTPRRSVNTKATITIGEEQQKPLKPSNLCTNLDEWRKKTASVKSQAGKAPEIVKKETAVSNSNKMVAKETAASTSNKRNHQSLDRSDSPSKKMKTERGRTPSKSKGVQRSCSFSTVQNKGTHKRGYSGDRSAKNRSGSAVSVSSDSDKKKPVMTVPTTPTFMRRKPIKMIQHEPLKSSEEREMDTIAFYKKELAKKRKEAQESHKMAMVAKGPTQVPSREPTRTQGFKFETDSRIKTHNMETRGDNGKTYEQTLRSNNNKQMPVSTKCGPTIPEPFHLTAQRKRKLPDLSEKQAEQYESMAQRLKAFTATPERFRSKPKEPTRGRSRSPPHGVTIPKTPQFETRTRTRPVVGVTREQQEKKEIEEAQRHQFKAKPVNHRILNNPNTGVKKVASKPLTVCEEFQLTSNNKKMERSQDNEEEHYEFHAQPLNKKILEGTVGLKSPKRLPVTMPASPAFALKNRVRLPHEPEVKEEKQVIRTRTPHYGIPFRPQLEGKTTQPQPFGFEERDKRKADEKARQIELIIEDENRQREFHANPLPDNDIHLPAKRVKPLTVKQPFNLDTEIRGMKKAEEWSNKLEEELRQQKEAARFKASEATVLEKEPFIPKTDHKFTSEFSEFELNTAKRVSKREVFETHLKTKQDQLDDIRRQEKQMRDAEEAAEMERLRREAVHKANPIKHFKTVAVKPSMKPLTAPMSPMFLTDDRLRTRAQHLTSNTSV